MKLLIAVDGSELALEAVRHALRLREARVPFETEIGSGEIAPTLLSIAQARGCDGIVLGARGLGAVRSALLGSVSQAILHAATLPVTVVRPIGADGRA